MYYLAAMMVTILEVLMILPAILTVLLGIGYLYFLELKEEHKRYEERYADGED